MADITQVQTFTTTVDAAGLNNIAETATVSGIVNADISASAAIADTKLATIATASKVNLTALVVTSAAKGDILYYNGTVWGRLAIGTTGQTLTVASDLPSWA